MKKLRLHGRNGLKRAFGRFFECGRKVRCLLLLLLVAAVAGGGIFVHQSLFVGKYRTISDGKLYRSRQPSGIQYSVLFRRQNFKRIINLRFSGEDPAAFAEEKSICRRRGVEFINMPMDANGPTKAQAEQFLFLVDTSPGPVLVHCEHGRNRTGRMTAIYRVARQGVPVEQAFGEELATYKIKRVSTNRSAIIKMLQQFVPPTISPDGTVEVAQR